MIYSHEDRAGIIHSKSIDLKVFRKASSRYPSHRMPYHSLYFFEKVVSEEPFIVDWQLPEGQNDEGK